MSVGVLLDGLTEPQRQAVTHTQGPMLVLAGAGSGKTRVITRRAAYLAATVAPAWQVLAITFTNKAAQEMKERIAALGVSGEMTVCTFHSLGARLLRVHHQAAGVAPNFSIADQSDRRKLVKEAIERADQSTANWPVGMIEEQISRAKNRMVTAEAFAAGPAGFFEQTISRIYTAYEQILAQQQVLDFDDLLLKPALLLERDEPTRTRLANRYRYVQVDEYQDTNAAQYRIARLLTQDHRNIFVTGDPDQSIYGWRGADLNNILSFERDYPTAHVVRLEQNYRSSQRILSAAGALIRFNRARKDKALWTENDVGPAVRVLTCADQIEEARTIADDLARHVSEGGSLSDCAVFYRLNSLSRTLEESFLGTGIPYRIARGVAFYARKEIKDVLGYLRVLINPRDDVSLERILNTPARGIGQTTVDRLLAAAAERGGTLLDVILDPPASALTRRTMTALKSFADLLTALQPVVQGSVARALRQTLLVSGLQAALSELGESDPEPQANVNELVSAAAQFDAEHADGTLLDWLSYTSLLGDEDLTRGEVEAVSIMTLHAAKGLEFPVVYIIGVEQGLLPFARSGEGVQDEEEERRLLFVGLTRAMQRLTLSRVRERQLHGQSMRTLPSRFLDELPREELEWVGQEKKETGRRSSLGTGELPHDVELWELGTLVRHPSYGLGQIVGLQRGPRRTHVEVRFESGRQASWVLEFAHLVRVDPHEIG